MTLWLCCGKIPPIMSKTEDAPNGSVQQTEEVKEFDPVDRVMIQWSLARSGMAALLEETGSAREAVRFLRTFSDAVDFEEYQRKLQEHILKNPADKKAQATSLIATNLLTCARLNDAVKAVMTPYPGCHFREDNVDRFARSFLETLCMADNVASSLKHETMPDSPFNQLREYLQARAA